MPEVSTLLPDDGRVIEDQDEHGFVLWLRRREDHRVTMELYRVERYEPGKMAETAEFCKRGGGGNTDLTKDLCFAERTLEIEFKWDGCMNFRFFPDDVIGEHQRYAHYCTFESFDRLHEAIQAARDWVKELKPGFNY